MNRSLLSGLTLLLFLSEAPAQTINDLQGLRDARTLLCEFTDQTSSTLIDGEWSVKQMPNTQRMAFDSISHPSSVARMVSTGGQLQAIWSAAGLTLIEGDGFSNHSFTTVLPLRRSVGGPFFAVSSIHILPQEGAYPRRIQQLLGTCIPNSVGSR